MVTDAVAANVAAVAAVVPVAVAVTAVGVVVTLLVGYCEFCTVETDNAVVVGPSVMMPGLSGRRSTTTAVLVAVTGATEGATIDNPWTFCPAAPVAVPPTTIGGLALALPTAVGPTAVTGPLTPKDVFVMLPIALVPAGIEAPVFAAIVASEPFPVFSADRTPGSIVTMAGSDAVAVEPGVLTLAATMLVPSVNPAAVPVVGKDEPNVEDVPPPPPPDPLVHWIPFTSTVIAPYCPAV